MSELHEEEAAGWEGRRLAEELKEEPLPIEMGGATAAEKKNEDALDYSEEGWAVVGDGVGSSGNGAEAARLAVDYLTDVLPEVRQVGDPGTVAKELEQALVRGHGLMQEQQAQTGTDMAATVSAMVIVRHGEELYAVIGNLGDCPAYLWHDGLLEELTDYHAWGDNPPKPVTRPGMGKPGEQRPMLTVVKLEVGDRVILATNGLRKNDPELKLSGQILTKHDNPQKAAKRMAKLSDRNPDARSVIVTTVV